jgi:hypothetical protein
MKTRLLISLFACLLVATILIAPFQKAAAQGCMDTCSWDGSCYQCHMWINQECQQCCPACPLPIWTEMSAKVPTLKRTAEGVRLPIGHARAVARVKAAASVHACAVTK